MNSPPQQTYVMVRRHRHWLDVDFMNFVTARKEFHALVSANRQRCEALFDDGYRLLGVTEDRERQGALRGIDIAGRV